MNKPIFEMTGRTDLDILLTKINKGANINIKDKNGDTALMLASYTGNTEICELLINYGADVKFQNKYGNTALMSASYNGNIDVCKLLIEKDSDFNIENGSGYTAIDIMKERYIYTKIEPYKILGLKYFQEVFKEHAEEYIDIFNTTLYSQDLELEDIQANIDMFYSTVVERTDNNSINESLEL